jgi:hypothetical protein
MWSFNRVDWLRESSNVANNSTAPEHRPFGTGTPKYHELLVFAQPTAGQEPNYNDWYDHQHIPNMLKVPGINAGQMPAGAAVDASRSRGYQTLRHLRARRFSDIARLNGSIRRVRIANDSAVPASLTSTPRYRGSRR